MMNEAQLHFRECEVCDRKSPGFVRITATAARPYCKNPPAAFLIPVGLLNEKKEKTSAYKTPHVPVQMSQRARAVARNRVNKGHHRGFIGGTFVVLLFGMHPPHQMLHEIDVNGCNVFADRLNHVLNYLWLRPLSCTAGSWRVDANSCFSKMLL